MISNALPRNRKYERCAYMQYQGSNNVVEPGTTVVTCSPAYMSSIAVSSEQNVMARSPQDVQQFTPPETRNPVRYAPRRTTSRLIRNNLTRPANNENTPKPSRLLRFSVLSSLPSQGQCNPPKYKSKRSLFEPELPRAHDLPA